MDFLSNLMSGFSMPAFGGGGGAGSPGAPMNISPPAQGQFNPDPVGSINGQPAPGFGFGPPKQNSGALAGMGMNMMKPQPFQQLQQLQMARPVGPGAGGMLSHMYGF